MAGLGRLNLQRNTKVLYSTQDVSTATAASFTPRNTWRVEVLAGYAFSQGTSVQDITSLESGETPDRSTQRFNTSINPVDWNFQTYLRPTRATSNVAANAFSITGGANVQPVADWFLWQALLSNTSPASGLVTQSAWETGLGTTRVNVEGQWRNTERDAAPNVAANNPNVNRAIEGFIYFEVDDIIYKVAKAAVNEASVDGAIDSIAMTTWTGFGTELVEVTGANRTTMEAVLANSNNVLTSTISYHPWDTVNITDFNTVPHPFIQNRLSTLELTDTNRAAGTYEFPLTNFSLTISNNLTYLIPEELAALNKPFAQFTGSQVISGSLSAYLRSGDSGANDKDDSAEFLRGVISNTATNISDSYQANVYLGGKSNAPYLGFEMGAVQFNFPTHTIDDMIGITAEFLAQETDDERGCGANLTIVTKYA